MRLRACICGLLPALAACAQLPERVRVEIDDRTIEIEDIRPKKDKADEPR
jgi:hypothetical protein